MTKQSILRSGMMLFLTWSILFLSAGIISGRDKDSYGTKVTDKYKTGQVEKVGSIEMVYIEGGTFTMGSPENEKDRVHDEKQHNVTVSSFWMGKYELTQGQYKDVMGTNPSNFKSDNLPVERVSWYDAVEFCNRLSVKNGLKPCYKIDKNKKDKTNKNQDDDIKWTVTIEGGTGFRLPTEAEWEYACRAGTTTAYYWGNKIDGKYCWYAENSGNKTYPVGQKKANAWGLYDMNGNVWEWCYDWHDFYGSVADDPKGADGGHGRVFRGGSCYLNGECLRSAYRISYSPYTRSPDAGFRVVRSVD